MGENTVMKITAPKLSDLLSSQAIYSMRNCRYNEYGPIKAHGSCEWPTGLTRPYPQGQWSSWNPPRSTSVSSIHIRDGVSHCSFQSFACRLPCACLGLAQVCGGSCKKHPGNWCEPCTPGAIQPIQPVFSKTELKPCYSLTCVCNMFWCLHRQVYDSIVWCHNMKGSIDLHSEKDFINLTSNF